LRERACYHTDAQKKTEREGQEHPRDCFRPVTLIWTQSASCQFSVVTPQVGSGTQYIFSQWQDGTTSTTDTVSAPVTSAVYTASFTAGPAGLYSPTQGSTLAGSSATFEWYGPQGTTAFWIDVGSSAGGNNYYQSGSLPTSTVSATVNSLPTSGGQVYVTLYWLLNGSSGQQSLHLHGRGGRIRAGYAPVAERRFGPLLDKRDFLVEGSNRRPALRLLD
jgi:hypothetical protein